MPLPAAPTHRRAAIVWCSVCQGELQPRSSCFHRRWQPSHGPPSTCCANNAGGGRSWRLPWWGGAPCLRQQLCRRPWRWAWRQGRPLQCTSRTCPAAVWRRQQASPGADNSAATRDAAAGAAAARAHRGCRACTSAAAGQWWSATNSGMEEAGNAGACRPCCCCCQLWRHGEACSCRGSTASSLRCSLS